MAERRELSREEVVLELRKLESRYDLWQTVVKGLIAVACVLVAAVPIRVFGHEIVDPVAGKTTVVDVDVVLKWSLAFSAALNGIQFGWARQRRRELQRQRDDLDEYERDSGLRRDAKGRVVAFDPPADPVGTQADDVK
jgi:hypothetical protein